MSPKTLLFYPKYSHTYPQAQPRPNFHRLEILHIPWIEKHVSNSRPPPVDLERITRQYNPLQNNVHGIAFGQLPPKNGGRFNLIGIEVIDPEDEEGTGREVIAVVERT